MCQKFIKLPRLIDNIDKVAREFVELFVPEILFMNTSSIHRLLKTLIRCLRLLFLLPSFTAFLVSSRRDSQSEEGNNARRITICRCNLVRGIVTFLLLVFCKVLCNDRSRMLSNVSFVACVN